MNRDTQINSFVFMDLETTGVPNFEPPGVVSRITEVSFVSVQRKAFLKGSGELPRSVNKLSLMNNPGKKISSQITRITGISTEMLRNETPFNKTTAILLKTFLQTLHPPVCLIAHNGIRFDFPLLRSEMNSAGETFPQTILCADSLKAFRALSRKLNDKINEPVFSPFITTTDLECCDVLEQIEKQLAEKSDVMNNIELIRQLNETTPIPQIVKVEISSNPSIRKKLIFEEGDSSCKNYKLANIYERMFGEKQPNTHRAEDDSVCLARCCLKYGQLIVDWFDENNMPFNDITPTYK